jgi:prolipoprotein diacylglyceryltransferase
MNLEINLQNGNQWYQLFFSGSIIFAGLCYFYYVHKNKIAVHSALTMYACAVLCFLIGAKLSTVPFSEWQNALSDCTLPETANKSVLGGIIGVLIGIPVFKRFSGFNGSFLDSFSISFPIAMAIQRIGCLLNGCCYGTSSDGGFTISYCTNYTYHSEKLYPNQIYQVLACLAIAAIVWRYATFFKRQNNRFFASVTLYAFARFFLEFTRDSSSVSGFCGGTTGGLKNLQWILLAVTLVSTIVILYREKYSAVKPVVIAHAKLNAIIILSVLTVLLWKWFDNLEVLISFSFMGIAVFTELNHHLVKTRNTFKAGWISVFCVVLFPAGTIIAQKAYNEITANDNMRNTFTDVSLEFGEFKYSHYHQQPSLHTNGCGDPYYETHGPLYRHQSYGFAGGITKTYTKGKFQQAILQGNITGGWDTDIDTLPRQTIGLLDFSTSASYNYNWVGGGFGFHVSNGMQEIHTGGVPWTNKDAAVLRGTLSFHLRVGPPHLLYVRLSYNELNPDLYSHRVTRAIRLGIGSGLGFRNGTHFEIGIDYANGTYFELRTLLWKKYSISGSWLENDNSQAFFQFGFAYRIKQKHWIEAKSKKKKVSQ